MNISLVSHLFNMSDVCLTGLDIVGLVMGLQTGFNARV